MSDHHNAHHSRPSTRLLAVAAGFSFLLAACGSDAEEATATSLEAATTTTLAADDGATDEGSERTIVTTDGDASSDAEAAGDASATTAPAETTTSTQADDGDGDVAGEPLDFGPTAGTPLAIVGVAWDDTLNFRSDPSPDANVVQSFGPLSTDLDMSALGEAWAAPSGVWWQVEIAGDTAWANQAFLGSLGTTINGYDQLIAELDVFEYDTIEAAALAVAELRSSEDPLSRVVFASEPLAFETGGALIVDVLDLGDDSVKGERIRVEVQTVFDEESGEEGAQDIDHFRIVDIELTPICGRGLSGGLCV